MKKQFKIGEYAIGGIIEVEITGNYFIAIKALDWDTKEIVASDSSERPEYIQSILRDWTSIYHADNIMEYINSNIKTVKV